MKMKDLLQEGRTIQESFKKSVLKEEEILDNALRVKFIKAVDAVGKPINDYRSNLLKDIAKKMTEKYGTEMEKFFEPYIGQPLPAEMIRLFNQANSIVGHKKITFSKDFDDRLKDVEVKVVGTGQNYLKVVARLKFQGGQIQDVYLWDGTNLILGMGGVD